MDNISAKSSYDGVTSPAPSTQVHSAAEYEDRRVELQGAVTDSGQTLVAADPAQLSKAMFANGVGAQSMLDSGSANTVVLTPVTGASGLRVATPIAVSYALLKGAVFVFKANTTNTGNVTVNVGQTVGTLIGAQPLFLPDGVTNIPAGMLVAGSYYTVLYDSTLDADGAFVLLGVPFNPSIYTGLSSNQSSTVFPDGQIFKKGKVNVAQNAQATVNFTTAFPNAAEVCTISIDYPLTTTASGDLSFNTLGISSVVICNGLNVTSDIHWQVWGY